MLAPEDGLLQELSNGVLCEDYGILKKLTVRDKRRICLTAHAQ